MVDSGAAHLFGVWAKWDRGVEQLDSLNKQILAFGTEPHPYTVISRKLANDRYRFEIYPAWQSSRVLRWGAVLGEIVHDFRSALDNLVWQLVLLNGGVPDEAHNFPVRAKPSASGFTIEMRRQWTDKRGALRHGPLFGVSDDAANIVETSQPYNGGRALLLQRLHGFWNLDKHRHLAPVSVVAQAPVLIPAGAVLDREDCLEGGTYVVEATARAGTHLDVHPQPPSDMGANPLEGRGAPDLAGGSLLEISGFWVVLAALGRRSSGSACGV